MEGYGQFCPVAMGAEVFANRLTPLILRELMAGSRRFSELQRGLPRISRNLLTQRLASMERAGLIERRRRPDGHGGQYLLTEAGEQLRPVVVVYFLDASYANSLADVSGGAAEVEGIAAGQEAAAGMLSLRSADHFGDVVRYTPGNGPGAWMPTPPAFLPALDPGWGQVTPYLIRSGSQFRPGPPPALTSRTYTRDFNELVSVGSAASAARTPGQTTTAASGHRPGHRNGISWRSS